MKIQLILGLALLGMITTVNTSQALDIGADIVSIDVAMKNVDDSMVSLKQIKGEKGTLVIFSCNHCPYVKAWQDEMVAIGNTYSTNGVGVVFINSNDPDAAGDTFEAMQELASEKKYAFPYVVDATSDVAKKFGASKTPDVFLFNAEGKLVYKGAVSEGGRAPKEGGTPYLKNALDAMLAGAKVDQAVTKAVGCSIKFR
jgi:thioredoxin-related protein